MIVQEIGAYKDSPEELVHDYFTEAAYPEQAIGRTILGTPDSVTSFDRSAVGRFLARNYKTAHTVVAAAGKVEHERFTDEVERLFARFPQEAPPVEAEARYLGGEMREDRRAEQAHVMLGFGGVSYLDEAHDAVQVFASAVGGGMSSRLFQDIRETRGLAYSIYAFHAPYRDTGAFGVYAGTDPKKTRELALVTLDVLRRAADDLTQAEIRRAKAQSKMALLSAQEAAAPRASFMARSLLAYGRVLVARGAHRAHRPAQRRGGARRGAGLAAHADVGRGRRALEEAAATERACQAIAAGPAGAGRLAARRRLTWRSFASRTRWPRRRRWRAAICACAHLASPIMPNGPSSGKEPELPGRLGTHLAGR